MPVIEITSLEHSGVEMFGTLTDAQLRNRMNAEKGIFIAESPKVIRVALDAGPVISLLPCFASGNILRAMRLTSLNG